MIVSINAFRSSGLHESLVREISVYYEEVRHILPKLPRDLQIYFDNFCLLEEFGTGGFAYDTNIITIAYNADFSDKDRQRRALRATIFHESFHLAQGYHGQMGAISPIEEAVYEGAATVFEREYANGEVPYGDYADEPVQRWVDQITRLDGSFDRDTWKYWDDDEQVRWKMYKAGTYIIDQVLKTSGKNIIQLNDYSAREIIAMYDQV